MLYYRIQQNNLVYYVFKITAERERAEVGQRQVRQVHLFSISSRLVSYRRRLQSCHFRVTEICVVMDRQSSQGLELQKSAASAVTQLSCLFTYT